ncbi:hypothetical protein D4A92_09450 [Rhizobium rosettiformans]|uniref:DUF1834 family protein n=2 Tax=Rhizobium TaxID=379 RepID=A0ABX7ETS3_9HYPH|nr:hypothetical protein [Rhizobium rosettiformans]QRF51643.1 hypothetical protein D4A92_09450 [Rhizobium rosettiformans]
MASFDLATIRRQEPLIIDRLRQAFPAQTFGIERVPQSLSLTEFKRVVKQAPMLGLAWAGMQPQKDSGRQLKGVMQWRLILICRVSSGLEARFKGDRKDIGLDAMTDVALALIHGVTMKPVGVMEVTQAQSLVAEGYADDDIALAQIDFNFSFVTSPADYAISSPESFEQLGITWSVSGSDGPGAINDTIEPPQE